MFYYRQDICTFHGNYHIFNPFQNKPCPQFKSFENSVGKGEIARDEQFLLFPQCFLTFLRTLSHVYLMSNCCLQTLLFWKSLKFVIWERVKSSFISLLWSFYVLFDLTFQGLNSKTNDKILGATKLKALAED